MRKKSFNLIVLLCLLLMTGCGMSGGGTPTETPTQTVPPLTATKTPKPSSTPKPTRTPNGTATKVVEELSARREEYFKEGYISTLNGILLTLDNYSMDWAQMDYFSDMGDSGYSGRLKNFVFTADFHWENAVDNPETSGCGIIYRYQDNGDFYSTYLDTERVVVGGYAASAGNFIRRFGVTSGEGTVDFENPADAHFVLIANENMVYVLVDDEFIGSYTLYQDKLLEPGWIGYFTKSGTNKDFGTRCKISNASIWAAKEK